MEKMANAKRFDFQTNAINKTYLRMYRAWAMELANSLLEIYTKIDDDDDDDDDDVCACVCVYVCVCICGVRRRKVFR